MRNARHTGRTAADYDKKFEFTSPDARGSSQRTAFHRYLPAERRSDPRPAVRAAARSTEDDGFSTFDFRPRWWPAPDSSN